MTRDVTVLAEGHSFLEGPRWHDGRLYASDFFTRRVLVFGEDGSSETVCSVEGMSSGLGFDPDGALLISSMTDKRVLRLRDGELELVADLADRAGGVCNDLLADERGGAYVGNFGWDVSADDRTQTTDLLYVGADGAVTVAASGVVFPNGMTISPDGATLLLAETFAGRISAFDRAADGTLSNRRFWAEFEPGGFETTTAACASGVPLPDGMALDADGAVWIGDAAGSGAVRVGEGGEILDRVEVGEGQTAYAVALGGADRRTLFLCAAVPFVEGDPANVHVARLLSCRVEVPGAGRP
ncbi:SMP-30/gluconolactonase/LRE family protein [Conexibacter woesei]|uniref:SMP-30/Gluconolaconase/LRE domain protein n=1 Tax=Conexibacter woesei (strain DSM 14684 / CCUG 47730 / CIP 108061 / JCM 11494 / NBRC 100937 / ID131577) TaxID=469383 RepID=D3FD94_CONWI|nr:SMP-30/gluconolactonase/LRE family protein [Conexibacter woesei]ADB53486.1 SMP-30/Gluconolaconase/LRE domain protein [Conexibacter woesei DSM 14684]